MYGKLVFNKGDKVYQWGWKSLFNKLCWDNWISLGKKVNFHPYKIQIIDLSIEAKTMKLLKENVGENLYDFKIDKDFLDKTPNAQNLKEKSC